MTSSLLLSALVLTAAGCDNAVPVTAVSDGDLARGTIGVEQNQALITFCAGQVNALSEGARRTVTVGDWLTTGQTLQVGASSSCELQVGETAVVMVEENTELVIANLLVKTSGTRVDFRVEQGSVLSKVSKLSGGESFRVRTRSAVCGVRGTEFSVRVSGEKTAIVAVRRGSVYVLPVRADAGTLKTAEADAMFSRLEKSAPAVAAGQELSLTPETLSGMEEALGGVITEIEKLQESDAVSAQETQNLIERIDASVPALRESAPQAQPLSPERETEIRKLDRAVFLPVAVRASAAPREGEAVTPAEPALVKIDVTSVPGDADIALDGRVAGQGRFQGIYPEGTRLAFSVRREGYGDATLAVSVSRGGERTFRVVLKKQQTEEGVIVAPDKEIGPAATADADSTVAALKQEALLGRYRVAGAAFIGDLAASGRRIFGADKNGTLYALSADGKLLWRLPTQNDPNNNSSPIIHGQRVYFSGLRELVIADANTGTPLARVPLEGASNHMFGRHIIVSDKIGVLPEDRGLRFFNLVTGATEKTILLPDDTRMTPTLYKGKLYMIDVTGRLQIVDPRTDALDPEPLATDAAEPVAIGIAVNGYRGYAAGRRNKLICLDLSRKKVLWEKDIANPEYAYQDLAADEQGVFVYAGKTLFGFSPQGKPLFAPLTGISAPPLLAAGRLYAGTTAGQLRVFDPRNGAVRATLALRQTVSARPVAVSGKIAVGTADGEIILIDPRAL